MPLDRGWQGWGGAAVAADRRDITAIPPTLAAALGGPIVSQREAADA